MTARPTSTEVRRRALRQSASRQGVSVPRTPRIHASERRRYRTQLWTNAAFAAVWPLLFVLSGSWLFVALAGAFGVLSALAGWCLLVLRRRDEVGGVPTSASS